MKVKTYHNGDDVFIAWKPDGFIAGCRGFALFRRRNDVEEVVSTWVGFEDDTFQEGERRASINWPIQKYQWTDYMANPGDRLQYRVVPMVGPDKRNLRQDNDAASDWTKEITLTHEFEQHISAYFNRGIVAAQWVSRRLGITASNAQTAKLTKVIDTPGDPFRNYLAGPLGARLFALLDEVVAKKRDIYAALYELDDPQLEQGLARCGKRAHVVLANGSVKKKGEDQNAAARAALEGKIDLHDRMISPRALGHNKFLVVCDDGGAPRWVWTGSQNWSETGLCTQANNSVLIDDAELAGEYRRQWQLLKDAGDETPASLKQSNDQPRDDGDIRLWFTPTTTSGDLEEARTVITGAEHIILFLMFNPGPKDTLLNEILDVAQEKHPGTRLYIQGAINQDPSTAKNPVQLFDDGNQVNADFGIVLPAAIDDVTTFWRKELLKLPKARAMVHSKVVVVDPLSANATLITGSHNLGPKASQTNDENLLIIRNVPLLAQAYATNVMSVYNQYRWRFRRSGKGGSKQPRWKGLQDTDSWQNWYLKPGSKALREINLWTGEPDG